MPSTFWSNTIWYVLLGVVSIIELVLILKKSRNKGLTIAFSLAVLGFLYSIEFILIIALNAYMYYPKIVSDVFQDSVLGNIFSQISITATAVLIIVYNLSFKWYVLFSAIYASIEVLFVRLGIFEHYWYRAIITLIGFVFLFWFIKTSYYKFISSSKPNSDYLPLYLGVFAIFSNTMILPLKLLGIQIYHISFFGIISKDHVAAGFLINVPLIIILINLHKRKVNVVWKTIVFITLSAILYALSILSLIHYREGWAIPSILLNIFGVYFWIVVLERLLSNKPAVEDTYAGEPYPKVRRLPRLKKGKYTAL